MTTKLANLYLAVNNYTIVDNYAKRFGFSLHHTTNSPNYRTYYNFDRGITLSVDVENNLFELVYVVDGLFHLKSGNMSPFYEKEPKYYQFEKMYERFIRCINRL